MVSPALTPVTDPLLLQQLQGDGGTAPANLTPVTDPMVLKALSGADEGASGPLGDAQPGTWAHMGNWALGQGRDLGHAALTTTLRAGAGLLDQAYGMAGPEYGGNNPGTVLADKFFDNAVPAYQPKTGIGRTAMAATEGGLSGALFGPGAAALGAAGAGSADAAAQATNDNPYVSGAVGLTVPAILGHPYGKFNSAESMVARRTGNMTPADWARAQALQGRSNDIGAPLLSTEAMNNPAMHQLTADVMSSPMGGPIHDAIAARPNQVRSAVNNEVLDLTTRQPVNPSELGPTVQERATEALKAPETARTATSQPFFDKAATQNVTEAQLKPVLDSLNKAIALQGDSKTAVKNELVKLRDSIGDETGKVTATQIGPISAQTQDFFNRSNYNPANPDAVSKAVSGAVTGHAQAIEKVLQTNNDYAAGRWSHGAMTPPVNEAQALPLRDIAATDIVPTQYGAITNPKTAGPANIKATANALNMQDHTSFPGLARAYFENAFNDVQKGPRANLDNPASGVDFVKAVNGTDQQRANNRAILEGVAQAHGVSSTGLIAGFDNAMEIFSRMGKIPGIGSPTVSRGAAAAEASTGLGTKIPGFQFDRPLSMLSDKLKGVYYERAYRSLAGAITSPDGVEQLRQLSMLNPSSRQAQAIVGTMIGAASGAEQPTQ